MGWQDRDYARGASYDDGWTPVGGGLRRLWHSSTISRLIVINVAVFIACLLTTGSGYNPVDPIHEWGVLDYAAILQGQIWRLVTPIFLHVNFMHLLFNMFGLWMFGKPVESQWGPRATMLLFMVSAVLGNVVYLILVAVHFFPPVQALGASGGVLAMMGAAAVLMPRLRFYIYGFIGVPLGMLALFYGGGYLVNALTRGPNAGGDVCHVVGMLSGAGYAWTRRFGRTGAPGGWSAPSGARRMARGGSTPSFLRPSEVDRDREELDQLLRKVHDHGLESLTVAEHRRLTEITDRLRSDFDA